MKKTWLTFWREGFCSDSRRFWISLDPLFPIFLRTVYIYDSDVPVLRNLAGIGSQPENPVRRYLLPRQQRHLPLTFRQIDHVVGDSKARNVTTQRFHDLQARPDRSPEVGSPFHQIHLMQIIRLDPHRQESAHQLAHDFRVVVDPFEQDRLIAEWYPGIGKDGRCGTAGAVDLFRVIEMGIYVDGMIAPQHACQLRGYPFWECDGNPGADAD